jgi:hypothetical protein
MSIKTRALAACFLGSTPNQFTPTRSKFRGFIVMAVVQPARQRRIIVNARNRWMTAVALAVALGAATPVQAHCDTLDGPVVAAARNALETGNVNLVLVWVQKADEADIRNAFQRSLSVRKAGGDAKLLADTYFFETLVRIHRVGEGAGYTGLKPSGTIEPAVAAADKAIETGRLQGLAKVIADRTEKGLHDHFEQVVAKKKYNPNDVAAGRAYSSAYVEFVHYAERLYDAAETMAPEAGPNAPVPHTH